VNQPLSSFWKSACADKQENGVPCHQRAFWNYELIMWQEKAHHKSNKKFMALWAFHFLFVESSNSLANPWSLCCYTYPRMVRFELCSVPSGTKKLYLLYTRVYRFYTFVIMAIYFLNQAQFLIWFIFSKLFRNSTKTLILTQNFYWKLYFGWSVLLKLNSKVKILK
jgi:hypothetical protein